MARWKWLLVLTPLWLVIAAANVIEGDMFVGVMSAVAAVCFVLAGLIERRRQDRDQSEP